MSPSTAEVRRAVRDFVEDLRIRFAQVLPRRWCTVGGVVVAAQGGTRTRYRFRIRVRGQGAGAAAAVASGGLQSALSAFRSELIAAVREAMRESQAKHPGVGVSARVGEVRIPVDDVAGMVDAVIRRVR
jgi:hypothetical protein